MPGTEFTVALSDGLAVEATCRWCEADLMGLDDPDFATYLRAIGIPIATEDLRIVSESSVTLWQRVKRGMGVGPMLSEVAKRTPDVVNILPDMDPISVPIWLVTHQALASSPRIRLVQTILAEELARM